jgi:excisionase family DNA binding protein
MVEQIPPQPKISKLALELVKDQRLTLTIPETARRLGIGRNQGYEAARRGEIPTVRLGKRLVVPVAALEAMLSVKSQQEIAAAELLRRIQQHPAE